MTKTTERPLVTFAVIAYNQERFIREAVEGAFAQTYKPLEIILSDDGSPDRTFDIMREMAAAYAGPHRVVLNRNEPNKGLAEHFNKILMLSNGVYLVVAAGDDISDSERVNKSVCSFLSDGTLSYVETLTKKISSDGTAIDHETDQITDKKTTSIDQLMRGKTPFAGAARAYRRASLMQFPPLQKTCPTEDTTNLLRCLLTGSGEIIPYKGVKWRMHENNLSSKDSIKNMKMTKILDQYKRDLLHAKRINIISWPTYIKQRSFFSNWIFQRSRRQQEDSRAPRAWKFLQSIFAKDGLQITDKLYALLWKIALRG